MAGAGSDDAPPSVPLFCLQVVYMFIQIWADRAVSELLDARTGPEAWARPTLPLHPHAPHQQQQQASSSSRAPPPTASAAASSASPAVLVSPLEALLRRCFHLINPEGAAAEPSIEFKEVRCEGKEGVGSKEGKGGSEA